MLQNNLKLTIRTLLLFLQATKKFMIPLGRKPILHKIRNPNLESEGKIKEEYLPVINASQITNQDQNQNQEPEPLKISNLFERGREIKTLKKTSYSKNDIFFSFKNKNRKMSDQPDFIRNHIMTRNTVRDREDIWKMIEQLNPTSYGSLDPNQNQNNKQDTNKQTNKK